MTKGGRGSRYPVRFPPMGSSPGRGLQFFDSAAEAVCFGVNAQGEIQSSQNSCPNRAIWLSLKNRCTAPHNDISTVIQQSSDSAYEIANVRRARNPQPG
jgi:hypothetical protein